MRMTEKRMYQRFVASDPSWDGAFFAGIRTTGIYCLPSCRARKPRLENVRFFPTAALAREAGFRACRKCHPDDFARGADPVLETIERVVAEARAEPARFPGVPDLVRRSGFGATRLFELFRRHYHLTPAEFLTRARLDAARAILAQEDGPGLPEVAARVGFESLSAFHDQFRRRLGLTPAAYRGLRSARRFELALPADYPLDALRRHLGRDPHSIQDRLEGDRYLAAVRLGSGPALLRVRFAPEALEVEVEGGGGRAALEAHAVVIGMLGLEQDREAFGRLVRRAGLLRLVGGQPGLPVFQQLSPFDGLVWSIVGQQVHLLFAGLLRRRLAELAGEPVSEGLRAAPRPEAVAALDPAQLVPLQFSRRKAEYLIGIAQKIAGGEIPLERMREYSATRAERLLLGQRGFGPWSVNYLLMRALGFADCVPYGDTGLTSGLKKLFRLRERPDPDETRRLMAVFSPHRSLATFHLWQLNRRTA